MSRRKKVHGMSLSDQYMNEVGPRCGWWLRSAWSGSRAKNVANLLDISEQQAKRLLAGARPTSEQLVKLARHFGWRFVNFVMEPAVGTPAMYAEMQAMDARLSKLESDRGIEDARGTLAIAGTVAGSIGADAPGDRTLETRAPQVTDRAAARRERP